METNTQEIADVLLRLEEPFDKDEVKWLVAATSRDGRKGRVTPYANPRAYTDRLNEVLTASGWTRQYTVHTISPVTRLRKDKMIQTGKVLVTCTVCQRLTPLRTWSMVNWTLKSWIGWPF